MGEVNLLSFRTEQLMEKTKENQDVPQRENDIHGVAGSGEVCGVLGWTNTWG